MKWFVMDSDKEYIEEEEVLFDDYSSSYIQRSGFWNVL